MAQARDCFGSLSATEFPPITSLADELPSGDGDAAFQFGLEVLVGGLDSLRDWRLPG